MLSADNALVSPGRPVVLVVDDEILLLECLREMLVDSYEVITTTRGSDAFDIVRRTRVDLVLLDVLMPGLDGLTVLRELKRVQPGVPVIVMSGLDHLSLVVTAMRDGAVDFLRKPFVSSDLAGLVKDAITRPHAGRPAVDKPASAEESTVLVVSREVGALAALEMGLPPQLTITVASSAAAVLRYPPRTAPTAVVIDPLLPARDSLMLVQMARGPWRSQLVFASLALDGGRVPATTVPAEGYVLRPGDVQELMEQLAGALSSESCRVQPPRYRPSVQRAIVWMVRNYRGRVTAPLVARASGISLRQLSDVFRADTGLSLMHYVTRLRAHVARCLLAEPHVRLEEVAEAAGFSDASHLSRVFLQEMGRRPGHYRRTLPTAHRKRPG
jgi:DNA-binding NtrC family response regulator